MSLSANYPAVRPSLLLDFANSKRLDPRITFTRATTATYYDGSTSAKAEENMFLYSQVLTNGNWTNFSNRLTITDNYAAAPDGTTTAARVQHTSGSTGYLYQNIGQFSAGETWTISVYAKSNTGSSQTFNFMIPVTSSLSSNQTATTSWQRFTFTITISSANNFAGIVLDTAANHDILFWGFQVEERSSVTSYFATTSTPIGTYVPALQTASSGVARFDHNPVTSESLGLLIEQSRTNLMTYSADFSNAAWSKVRSSIIPNTIIAPDGTLTGSKLVEDNTASNTHFILQNVSLGGSVDSSPFVVSIYAKAGERTTMQMFDNNSVASGSTVFDLSTGTIVSGTGKITSVGNGWYRCSIYPLKDYATNSTAWIMLHNGSTNSYTGNGFSGIYIWGGQLEAASFETSYIPTTGASATRNADVVVMSGTNFSSWYTEGEGAFFAEASTAVVTGDTMVAEGATATEPIQNFSLTFATTSTQFINRLTSSSNDIRKSSAVASKTMVKFSGNMTGNTSLNIGSTSGTTASSTGNQAKLTGADRMYIGSRTGSSLFLNAPIRKLAYYSETLTQAQHNALTS